MSEYILIIVWLGIMALAARKKEYKRIEDVCGKCEERYRLGFALLVFAPIIWMAGTRSFVGDTGMYYDAFSAMPSSLSGLSAYALERTKDTGFYVFSALVKIFITDNAFVYLTILAIIQGLAVLLVYRKYSTSYIFSIFLFVISTDYVAWMYNGIRQFTAVIMIFVATTFMLKRKYMPLVLVILLASTMHQTALIMIPLVFIAQGEAWNKKTLMFIVLALLAILFVGEFTDILDVALEETQYENVISDYESFQDDGTNPLRVLIYSIPAILAFLGRKIIRRVDDPLINFCTNMSIISAGLYLISMVTSGIYMGRLPIYASLYGYILLPWEIENIFNHKSRKIVYAGLILCYFLFYYYQMHFTWGLI